MLGVDGLFETHLNVANLERSIRFYRDIVGLPFARAFPERQAAFFWIGAPGQAMLGLWGSSAPIGMRLHLAFTVSLENLMAAASRLRASGIATQDFFGRRSDTPSVFGWMPAASIYFDDPDGHSLELLTMLPGEARPELGVVSWAEW